MQLDWNSPVSLGFTVFMSQYLHYDVKQNKTKKQFFSTLNMFTYYFKQSMDACEKIS